MKKAYGVAVTLLFLFSTGSLWATPSKLSFSTYYGGFEDTTGKGSDNDYNDLVFSLSGAGLRLNSSSGVWNSKPAINDNGSPFWDHSSYDGQKYNVGYCIYGGGSCGKGLAPDAYYLANSSGGSENDVFFSVNGTVSDTVSFHIASDTDVLGWYLVSDRNRTIHWVNPGKATGSFSFTPGGDFGLVANNNGGNGGSTYYSQTGSGNSQFAFFGPKTAAPVPTPEPGTLVLLGTGVAGLIGISRRKLRKQ